MKIYLSLGHRRWKKTWGIRNFEQPLKTGCTQLGIGFQSVCKLCEFVPVYEAYFPSWKCRKCLSWLDQLKGGDILILCTSIEGCITRVGRAHDIYWKWRKSNRNVKVVYYSDDPGVFMYEYFSPNDLNRVLVYRDERLWEVILDSDLIIAYNEAHAIPYVRVRDKLLIASPPVPDYLFEMARGLNIGLLAKQKLKNPYFLVISHPLVKAFGVDTAGLPYPVRVLLEQPRNVVFRTMRGACGVIASSFHEVFSWGLVEACANGAYPVLLPHSNYYLEWGREPVVSDATSFLKRIEDIVANPGWYTMRAVELFLERFSRYKESDYAKHFVKRIIERVNQ